MGGIEVSVDHFPLVHITHHGGKEDDVYIQMFERMKQITNRGMKFVNVVEAPGPTLPTATQRKLISDWYVRERHAFNEFSIGTAVVANSALQSGAITAILWIMRPQVPVVSFASRTEALGWCRDKLVEHAVPIAPPLSRFFTRSGLDASRAG